MNYVNEMIFVEFLQSRQDDHALQEGSLSSGVDIFSETTTLSGNMLVLRFPL
jgi:hypothetical protein